MLSFVSKDPSNGFRLTSSSQCRWSRVWLFSKDPNSCNGVRFLRQPSISALDNNIVFVCVCMYIYTQWWWLLSSSSSPQTISFMFFLRDRLLSFCTRNSARPGSNLIYTANVWWQVIRSTYSLSKCYVVKQTISPGIKRLRFEGICQPLPWTTFRAAFHPAIRFRILFLKHRNNFRFTSIVVKYISHNLHSTQKASTKLNR